MAMTRMNKGFMEVKQARVGTEPCTGSEAGQKFEGNDHTTLNRHVYRS